MRSLLRASRAALLSRDGGRERWALIRALVGRHGVVGLLRTVLTGRRPD